MINLYFPDSEADTQINKELTEILEAFVSKLPAIDFASVVSLEGLPISSFPPTLPSGLDDVRVAAMTAAILSLGERAVMETGKGEMTRILVEGDSGYLISVQTGTKAVLTASASRSVKLGLIFLDMKQAAKKIGEILG
ncbi:MAG: roadblock/LC7 domain-containing protein [Candidatus Hodarchaeales archaeon]|jgi:predicted regulator of Ras-like GTPase activity (Roadblock/LC7/MglB family)